MLPKSPVVREVWMAFGIPYSVLNNIPPEKVIFQGNLCDPNCHKYGSREGERRGGNVARVRMVNARRRWTLSRLMDLRVIKPFVRRGAAAVEPLADRRSGSSLHFMTCPTARGRGAR